MSKVVPTESILAFAHSAIPGYDTAAHVVVRAEKWLRAKQSTFVPGIDAEGELQSAAESGTEFPEGLGLRIDAVALSVNARNTEIAYLKNFLAGSKERLNATVTDGVDEGLDLLSEQLADVVDAVRDQESTFKGLGSFEEIAAANDQEAFRIRGQWQDLAKRYAAIRSAQQTLVREAIAHEYPDNGNRFFLLGGQIADLVDHEAYFTARRTEPWDNKTRGFGAVLLPWREAAEAPVISAWDWKVPVPVEPEWQMRFVLRICTEAEPWVPSLPDMLEAVRLAELATSAPGRTGEAHHIDALLDLQELTGWESPLTPAPMKPRPISAEPKLSHDTRIARGRAALRERLNS